MVASVPKQAVPFAAARRCRDAQYLGFWSLAKWLILGHVTTPAHRTPVVDDRYGPAESVVRSICPESRSSMDTVRDLAPHPSLHAGDVAGLANDADTR